MPRSAPCCVCAASSLPVSFTSQQLQLHLPCSLWPHINVCPPAHPHSWPPEPAHLRALHGSGHRIRLRLPMISLSTLPLMFTHFSTLMTCSSRGMINPIDFVKQRLSDKFLMSDWITSVTSLVLRCLPHLMVPTSPMRSTFRTSFPVLLSMIAHC